LKEPITLSYRPNPALTNEKEATYEKLKIILLRKNEHFGDALMIDNKRSPLTIRTKSKIAEIFLMEKPDVMILTGEYSEIFEKIYTKISFNMFQIAKNISKAKHVFAKKRNAAYFVKVIKIPESIKLDDSLLNGSEDCLSNLLSKNNKNSSTVAEFITKGSKRSKICLKENYKFCVEEKNKFFNYSELSDTDREIRPC
jgi:hypothetical protein